MKTSVGFWGSVRDFWRTGKTGSALFLISVFVIIYGYIAYDYEITRGWKGHESLQNVIKDISIFIPVGGSIIGIIIGGIDITMLLSDWYLARQEKRIEAASKQAREEGLERGIEEGREQGIEQGRAEAYQAIADWNTRRLEAEAKGTPFNEPPPSQNGNPPKPK